MLKQLLADWNTAIQSRKVINGTTNPKGVVLTQTTKFRFRNTDFEMFTKIYPGDENAPDRKRRYRNEIFVPRTNKFVPNLTFKSHAAMMAAILCALTEGNEHEDKVAKREQERKEKFFAELRKERCVRLTSCGYTSDETEVLLNWLDTHVYDDHLHWCETAVDVMCKHYQYITGRGLIEIGINLKDEAKRHIDRMYTTIANLMRDTARDKYGYPVFTKHTCSKQFLFPKENLSYGVYTVRSAFTKIFNECGFGAKFHYVIELIATLYEHMTNTSLADKSAEAKLRQERMYENYVKQAANGGVKKNSGKTKAVATAAASMPLVGSSIGDLFGDVLDVVQTTEEKPKHNKHHKKSEKVVQAVTNGQVTSLQENLKKAKKAEAPAEQVVEEVPAEPEQKEEPQVAEEVATETTVEESNAPAFTDGFNTAFADALNAAGVDSIVTEDKPKKRTTRKKKVENDK